mmetsp:Transcript_30483/g.83550  ORF Transcript_30483/g.83550 Transcript_30483/m.83550 type:complete len:235 (+) Transcript_30483:856-1560(+)
MSDAQLTPWPHVSSGAAYRRVPAPGGTGGLSPSHRVAIPKSASFTAPSGPQKTLAGFTSRCAQPWAWTTESASASPPSHRHRTRAGAAGAVPPASVRSTACRVGALHSSIMMARRGWARRPPLRRSRGVACAGPEGSEAAVEWVLLSCGQCSAHSASSPAGYSTRGGCVACPKRPSALALSSLPASSAPRTSPSAPSLPTSLSLSSSSSRSSSSSSRSSSHRHASLLASTHDAW